MQKWLLICFLFVLLPIGAAGQQSIDGSFPFQSDPAKRYSLYIPSQYDEANPNQLILALHPLHQTWGNSTTWRNILLNFAEANSLILAAPDGGSDGRIDDPIDKAFMTALLDSVETWYTINTDKIFILGFSWGGRATYTYGLENHTRFAGFITIGSFVNGTGMIRPFLQNAPNEPFYIMHGDRDNTAPINTAFFPVRDTLISHGAIVESLILEGVGHTINFTDRDQIITDAYHWLDSVSTQLTVSVEEESPIPKISRLRQNYPNPFNPETKILYELPRAGTIVLKIFNLLGQEVKTLIDQFQPAGVYQTLWNGKTDEGRLAPTGIYIYRLEIDNRLIETRKMMLLQ